MLLLNRADLFSFANLFKYREGRRVLISSSISLGFMALVSTLFGQVVIASPEFAQQFRANGDEGVFALIRVVLLPALLLTTWFGFGGGRRLLFEHPTLELSLCSPMPVPALLTALTLRFGLLTTAWCTALCGPALRTATADLGYPLGWPEIVFCMFCLTVPMLCFLLTVQIVIQRWFAGRTGRIVMNSLSLLTSTAFSLMLLVGALAQEQSVQTLFETSRRFRLLPKLTTGPANLLADFATDQTSLFAILTALVAPAIGIAVLIATSSIYRVAYANSKKSFEPIFTLFQGQLWPASAAGSMFRKELAQLFQQPNQLVGLLFSAVVIVVMASSRLMSRGVLEDGAVPEEFRHCALMLGLWLFSQLAIAPGSLFRLTLLDAHQWTLYIGAPARPSIILRGKLYLAALLALWPAPVVMIVGGFMYDIEPRAMLWFAAILPAIVMWTTAATAYIGTIPILMRPNPDRNNLLGLIAVVLLLFTIWGSIIPAAFVWQGFDQYYHAEGPWREMTETSFTLSALAAIWTASFITSGIAFALGVRNFKKLTAPAHR